MHLEYQSHTSDNRQTTRRRIIRPEIEEPDEEDEFVLQVRTKEM